MIDTIVSRIQYNTTSLFSGFKKSTNVGFYVKNKRVEVQVVPDQRLDGYSRNVTLGSTVSLEIYL